MDNEGGGNMGTWEIIQAAVSVATIIADIVLIWLLVRHMKG